MLNLSIWLIFSLLLPVTASAQIERLVVGQGGLDWRESSLDMLGLTDSVAIGSLQPFEINPADNVAVGPQTDAGQFANIFGHVWEQSFSAPPFARDKKPWVFGDRGQLQAIDGDIDRPTDVAPIGHYSFDLGLLVPIKRVVFFPPDKGRTTTRGSSGLLIKDLYPRQYVVSGSANEQDFVFLNSVDDFSHILGSNFSQNKRIADVRFDTQFLRFFRVLFPLRGYIAEVQFYGEGYAPQTRYISQLFDMGQPVNFGKLHYDFEIYRSAGFGSEPILAPDATVGVTFEARSGRDDTPEIYHIVTDIGGEKEVTEKEFNRAPATLLLFGNSDSNVIPGQRGSVQEDVENWSFWSAPHHSTGEEIQVPDGRQFIQFTAFITSEEVFAFGRLNSVAIEFSPLLANPVLGEVALMEEPQPEDGVAEVPLGEQVALTYDVRADFTSDEQAGFNAIRLQTPEAVDFRGFEMGEPLAPVEPDSLVVSHGELTVYFPSHPVIPDANMPLRLLFGTRVFNFSTVFEGEVFQIGGENLPQSIDGGDATPLVSTNDLQVFTPLDRLQVLSDIDLGAEVVTPNGDGVNDELPLTFTLQGIEDGIVEVAIYDLSGRLVRSLVARTLGEGRYTEKWDGSGQDGRVAPGIYLVRVAVDTDLGTFEEARTIAVAY